MSDLRKSPRLEVVALVRGETDNGHTVTVVNASEGGMLVQSPRAFTEGQVHEFRFAHGRRPGVMMFQARVVHVTMVPGIEGCLAGLQFVEARTVQQRLAIQEVLRQCAPDRIRADA